MAEVMEPTCSTEQCVEDSRIITEVVEGEESVMVTVEIIEEDQEEVVGISRTVEAATEETATIDQKEKLIQMFSMQMVETRGKGAVVVAAADRVVVTTHIITQQISVHTMLPMSLHPLLTSLQLVKQAEDNQDPLGPLSLNNRAAMSPPPSPNINKKLTFLHTDFFHTIYLNC